MTGQIDLYMLRGNSCFYSWFRPGPWNDAVSIGTHLHVLLSYSYGKYRIYPKPMQVFIDKGDRGAQDI